MYTAFSRIKTDDDNFHCIEEFLKICKKHK